jgi:hypothetical protein
MKNFFDSTSYPMPVIAGECLGCGSPGDNWTPELAETFWTMTGYRWDGTNLLGYPLRKDCLSLGIESDHIPPRIELCLRCAVAYMTSFNAQLQVVQEQRRSK